MSRFNTLVISEKHRLTKDAVRLDFRIPAELKETFRFKPGQYITLKATVAGEEVRRSYSICNEESTSRLSVAVKEVTNGRFSMYASEQLQAGDVLEVMPPEGQFLVKETEGHHVFIAAGSGITPMMSMIPFILGRNTTDKVSLLFGNKLKDEVMFYAELEQLHKLYPSRLEIQHCYSREHRDGAWEGRVTAAMASRFISSSSFGKATEVYLCGPAEMIFSVKDDVIARGLSKEQVHFELFTAPVIETEDEPDRTETVEGASKITFRLDGQEYVIEDVDPHHAILDIALEAGIDAPFACQGGVCCTCKALVTGAKVDLRQNFSLSDKEVSEGYVLTCQSYHLGGSTVVDYDK
ncbi:MAG: FAD-binding oxidoreductase [Bacteroidetes bacterium]|jgi:ring-1,2-phenylacetyl-CoA epoxidase subunit PaaE|nr:FAD-binding oxidoreductase [Bacteroidota bacterium]